MKKAIVALLFLVLNISIAQEKRIINIPYSEKIFNEDISLNHIVLITEMENSHEKKIRLYNNSCELIFTKIIHKYYISSAFLSENSEKLIVAQPNACSPNEETMYVRGFDINSGQLDWEKCFLTSGTILKSPNREMILYNSSKIEIFNSQTGESVPLDFVFHGYEANWLDNERIVFIEPQTSIYPEYKNWKTSNKNNLNELKEKKRDLYEQLKKKEISSDTYSKKLEELKKLKSSLKKPRSNVRGVTNAPKKSLQRSSKIIIYNVVDKNIEVEKEIMDKDGNEFFIISDQYSNENIFVDKHFNIILSGWTLNNENQAKKCFLKINNNGKVLWSSHLKYDLTTETKLNVNGEIYVDVKELTTNRQYRLDMTREMEIEKNDIIDGIIVKYDKDKLGRKINFYREKVIDREKNTISIERGGDENEN